MQILSLAAYSASLLLNAASRTNSPEQAKTASPPATTADRVSISQAARELLASQSTSSATASRSTTQTYDTDQGAIEIDIDAYFAPGKPFTTLPPLLAPTANNIARLSEHITDKLSGFLARNGISAPPSTITYDDHGQIQLPADYAEAERFKQALAGDPAMERELRTVAALTSSQVEMGKSLPFQKEYAAASSRAETDAVVAKYRYLFSDHRPADTIALHFSANGGLSLSANGKPVF